MDILGIDILSIDTSGKQGALIHHRPICRPRLKGHWTSVAALKCDAAAEKSKDQLS
jgi:hypothetical protein